MNKKGVELSMNLIIIAAIGLLILVILAVLVIGSANKTTKGLDSCNLQLGICQLSSCDSGESTIFPKANEKLCTPSKPNCCKVVSAG
jgi:hypothetical protein